MAEIMLFHHVLGLTPGVLALADELRDTGHVVHTPDLFEGRTFDSIEEGAAYAEAVGFDTLVEAGVAVAETYTGPTVFAGISLGVLPAQRLAQTHPSAAGAVLLEACVPISEFGDRWPDVPVQIHGMDADPSFAGEGDVDAARELVADAGDDVAELFLYPGDGHLFTDRSISAHDPDAAMAVIERVVDFLAQIDAPSDRRIDEQGRTEPPLAGDEVATLLGFLDFQRATLEWKCRGLDRDGVSTTVANSSMTLGGLLKHLALVEDSWFSQALHRNAPSPPWDTVDWEADRDWDWHSASDDDPDELRALWAAAVERSRARTSEALATGGLDHPALGLQDEPETPSLRWILVHMIEEYARHNGHADLIREAIDGQTGE